MWESAGGRFFEEGDAGSGANATNRGRDGSDGEVSAEAKT